MCIAEQLYKVMMSRHFHFIWMSHSQFLVKHRIFYAIDYRDLLLIYSLSLELSLDSLNTWEKTVGQSVWL